jgi:hypothetical protein
MTRLAFVFQDDGRFGTLREAPPKLVFSCFPQLGIRTRRKKLPTALGGVELAGCQARKATAIKLCECTHSPYFAFYRRFKQF